MKSMKKLVLVGLVLLASVMVLVGCKMEAGATKVYTFPAEVKVLTDYESPNSTGSEWTYVEFGEWPQSEAKDVEENSLKLVDGGRGYFNSNYYKDDNDNYYVKHNGSYYKVEPIVWRVLNKDYASTGRALLLAENILIVGIEFDDDKNNYMESNIRKWLNGNSGTVEQSDYSRAIGFLQTAFEERERELIRETTVDNGNKSSFGRGETPKDNPNVCKDTKDMIFLLSKEEVTKKEYGFDIYTACGEGNSRIRLCTDYALATRPVQMSGTAGSWWLRSPSIPPIGDSGNCIYEDGYADVRYQEFVSAIGKGVVPALYIELQ